jgi:hypothetical protein
LGAPAGERNTPAKNYARKTTSRGEKESRGCQFLLACAVIWRKLETVTVEIYGFDQEHHCSTIVTGGVIISI